MNKPYNKLSVAQIFLLMSLSHALSQHSVTGTKNFLSHACPACKTLGLPAPTPQMQVTATRAGACPAQDSIVYPAGYMHKFGMSSWSVGNWIAFSWSMLLK